MAVYNTNMAGGINAKNCTADASKILDGYTAAVGKEIVEGQMPNNGDASTTVKNGVILEGYTSGGQIEGLVAENIKDGMSIGGVSGTAGKGTYNAVLELTGYSVTIEHPLGVKPSYIYMVGIDCIGKIKTIGSLVWFDGIAYEGTSGNVYHENLAVTTFTGANGYTNLLDIGYIQTTTITDTSVTFAVESDNYGGSFGGTYYVTMIA